jgi:hypothetical protein
LQTEQNFIKDLVLQQNIDLPLYEVSWLVNAINNNMEKRAKNVFFPEFDDLIGFSSQPIETSAAYTGQHRKLSRYFAWEH